MEHQLQRNNVSGVWKGLKMITGQKESSSQVEADQKWLLLKTCADQLCGILLYLFGLSLKLGKVPQLWKTSCMVPVPKTSRPKDFGDYRPVKTHTSHLMKTLERALSHLEKSGSTVRVMFFDFSSAFNTIQTALLRDKLDYMGVDHHLLTWILDYLTNRPQYVRVRDCESDIVVCSTGARQGMVLALFLFTVYTADFMFSSATCHLQKFSDDSAIIGLIMNDDDMEYQERIQDFVDKCRKRAGGGFPQAQTEEEGLLSTVSNSIIPEKLLQ
ncbi:hypothetical protein H4Q32_026094 [Labeo rohita]|uniref:Reverse transcriptase domain-containing protein n=1 Tax=Labeo rohita TaxID=84645 RepID=A0ABQ8L6Z0_LABRO|nr:hypothetical protein H4Q32_026094 [Labeo rohita]